MGVIFSGFVQNKECPSELQLMDAVRIENVVKLWQKVRK